MPTTPTGRISLPLAHLRRLLAASTSWQAWTGVTGEIDPAVAAAARVYYFDIPQPADIEYTAEELDDLRPFAVISFDPPPQFMLRRANINQTARIGGGAGLTFLDAGELYLLFEAAVPALIAAEGDDADAMVEFCNRVGGVLADMEALAGTNDYLAVSAIEFANPSRSSHDEANTAGDYIRVFCRVSWGI